jgi:hypothetical protein
MVSVCRAILLVVTTVALAIYFFTRSSHARVRRRATAVTSMGIDEATLKAFLAVA